MSKTRLVLFGPLIVLVTAWACAAIWVDGPSSRPLAGILALVFAAGMLAAFVLLRPIGRAYGVFGIGFLVVLSWWLALEPSNDREWLPEVARPAQAVFDGDYVTIENIRNFDYRSETDFTEHWETRTYDLSKIQGLDIFLSYWGSPMIAHTIMSWDFGDGRPLAISIETRKEVGEEYSAVLGFFRQFELYYVVADERDVVRVRTNYRGEDVKVYRIQVSPKFARALLVDYLEKIDLLAEHPRWYNAFTHNCTTQIQNHVDSIATGNPFDWRIIVNGYIDELGYERGNLDTSLPFEELRQRANITERAKAADQASDFSTRIRTYAAGS